MRVLITGSSGFIGNRTARYFCANGHEVIGWDRINIEAEYETVNVDLMNPEEIRSALKLFLPEAIIHCAGSADVGKSVVDPYMDFDGNVAITHNILFALHETGLKDTRFVFLSSAGVYGNPRSLPVTEDAPLNPMSPYAIHKVMCEELCRYFIDNYDMDVKIARIFSAYGAGLRKQIFWDMYQKYRKTGRLDMFGTGNETRDYIHVDDVVPALYLLAATRSSEVVFNVASGVETTIREATEMFAGIVGVPLENVAFNGMIREGDPLNWRADISKISALGYKPEIGMLDGLRGYVDWVNEQT